LPLPILRSNAVEAYSLCRWKKAISVANSIQGGAAQKKERRLAGVYSRACLGDAAAKRAGKTPQAGDNVSGGICGDN